MIRTAVIGSLGKLPSVEERENPSAEAGEVLITVEAAPVDPLDVRYASGESYLSRPRTPYVPGGQGVGRLADGTAVWFGTKAGLRRGDGSMASMVAADAAEVVALPSGVPLTTIAALGLSAVAAHTALSSAGRLAPGEQVLVLGAGGIVGQAAIQLALLSGARRVIAVARTREGRSRAIRLGASAAVPLQPGDDVASLSDRLGEAAHGPVDLVIDPVFGVPAAAALRVLRPGGRLVNLGSEAGETSPIESAIVRDRSLRIVGYTNASLSVSQRAAAIGTIARTAAAGRLTVDHEVMPVSDIASAWARQIAGTDGRRLVLAF